MIFRHLTGSLRKHGRISKGVLERSSSTNLHEIDPRGRERVIFTLDPSKFAEKKQQPLQIGDLQMFRPYIMLHSLSRFVAPVMAPRLIYDMSCEARTRKLLRYPPDTNAFLYYFTSPENPRIAGELRLRVTRSDNPESFESGFDLLKVNGQPWSRPLYVVAKCYYPLYKSLRGDQLVPDDLDAVVSTLPPISPRYRRRQLLYTLNDTFIVDFSNINRCFWVVTEHGTGVLRFLGPFAETRPTLCAPYTGSALVRFERSTLPDHKGTRTVVLRFLKIITPVKCMIPRYDGNIVQPKEGELHRKTPRNKSDPQVWSVNIDKSGKPMMRGLQLLWDT